MKSTDISKELGALIKRLRAEHPEAKPPTDSPSVLDPNQPLLTLFVRSFLLWDSTTTKAAGAMRRLEQALVDFNDLRVCLADELVAIMGERYPRAGERALALRGALSALFMQEHALTLEHLVRMSPEAQCSYLESLTHTPRYVVSRVRLLGLGAHAAPVDSRLLTRLVESHIVESKADAVTAAAAIERSVRPGELPEVMALLQAWTDGADIAIVAHEPARVTLRPAGPGAGGVRGSGANGSAGNVDGAAAPARKGEAAPSRKGEAAPSHHPPGTRRRSGSKTEK